MCCPKPQPMEFHPQKSHPERQIALDLIGQKKSGTMKTFEIVSHISSLWISSHPQSSTERCFQYFHTEKSFCVVMCCPKPQPMEFHPPKIISGKTKKRCFLKCVFFWISETTLGIRVFFRKVLPPLLFPFQFQNCCFESMLSFRIMIVLIVLINMICVLNVIFVCVCETSEQM